MATDHIEIKDCKDGYLYLIMARHARVGICSNSGRMFFVRRNWFGGICHEWHWDFDPRKGTVKPFAEIEECPFFKNNDDVLRYLLESNIKYAIDIAKMEKEFMNDIHNK